MSQLKLTKPAPDWRGTALVNGEFKKISLADFKGKYLVFLFYPLDSTFKCRTELIAFSQRVEEFKSIDCEVVACSTDNHFSYLAWVKSPPEQGGLGEINYPMLADKNLDISKAYGVCNEEGNAFRGLFIVDAKGNIRQITINDLPIDRSVDETLRLVLAVQFTDVKERLIKFWPNLTNAEEKAAHIVQDNRSIIEDLRDLEESDDIQKRKLYKKLMQNYQAKEKFVDFLKLGKDCDSQTICQDLKLILTSKHIINSSCQRRQIRLNDGGSYKHWMVFVVQHAVIDSTILQFCFPLTTEEQKKILTKYGLEDADVKVGWGNGLPDLLKQKVQECATFDRNTILDKPYYDGQEVEHPLYGILVK